MRWSADDKQVWMIEHMRSDAHLETSDIEPARKAISDRNGNVLRVAEHRLVHDNSVHGPALRDRSLVARPIVLPPVAAGQFRQQRIRYEAVDGNGNERCSAVLRSSPGSPFRMLPMP